jgi:regulator of sigma E protease
MSYVLALLGFMVLVLLHEAGHFAVAKAVGMRVERFSIFFPPLLFRKKIGETEYAIGAIPLGGYVKITGMNPDQELPDEVRTRAYHAQPPWKRIVVILAGPLVNFVLAAVLLFVFAFAVGPFAPKREVDQAAKGFPAAKVLHHGDKIVAVDGHAGGPERIRKLIQAHRCPVQPPVNRCRASTPATMVIVRAGRRQTLRITPIYSKAEKGMRLGFGYASVHKTLPFGQAVDWTTAKYWEFTKATLSLPARILDSQKRKEISGTVGAYEVTRQTIASDVGNAIALLALISLSLAIINLFPFLPLDGGHIFWAVVEKVRRRPVSFATMERASFVGFALVLGLFFIGLSNDIGRLTGQGFQVR